MELAIIIALTLALGTLLVSRIHFHFSFNLAVTRSAAQSGDNAGYRLRPNGRGDRSRNSSVLPPETAGAWNSPRSGGTSPNKSSSIRDLGVTKALEAASHRAELDIASALVNLGCQSQRAQNIARDAMGEAKDFDGRLRWAIGKA